MATLANLLVKVGVDASAVDAGIRDADRGISGFASRLDDTGKRMQHVGGIATVGLSLPLVGLGLAAVNAASSLNESMNAIGVVFGSAVGKIEAFGKTSAQTVGLSTRAFNELVTPVGAALQNVGFSQDQAADSSIMLAQRAADMASVFNTDVSSALEAIQAGLRGEADPLERFGVGLSDAAVTAKAMEMGLAATTGEIDAQDKAQARLALIMEQTERLSGDFAATSGEVANQERIATAEAENMAASFGQKLIPVKQKLIEIASSLVDWFMGLSSGTQDLIVKAGLLAVVFGPVVLALGTMARAISSVITLGAQMATGLISAGSRVAGFFAPGGGFDTVRLGLMTVGEHIGSVISKLASMVVSAATTAASVVASVATQLAAWALLAVQSLIAAAQVALAWLISMGPIILVVAAIAAAVFLIIKYWDEIKDAIMAAVNFVIDFVSRNWPLILAILTGPIGLAVLWIIEHWDMLVTATWNFLMRIVGFFQSIPGWISGAIMWVVNGIAGLLRWAWDNAIAVVQWGINTALWWIRNIPYWIWEALSGLGGLLWDIASNMMQNFVNAIENGIGWVGEQFKRLTNLIPSWKGPPARDKRLLRPAGENIMRGLLDSISDSVPELRNELMAVSDMIGGTIGAEVGARVNADIIVPAPAEPTRVIFDFRDADSEIGRALRKMVRVDGRGDAQVSFGG